jgi:hypothetical protein
MRKTLTALAVTATAFVAPMAMSGTAYAQSADLSAVTDVVNKALGGGCTTTYAGAVLGLGIGTVYTISGYTITVYGGSVLTYEQGQARNSTAFVNCMV